MKAHRLASYFPIMEDEKFEKFVEDIKENGQLEPIVTYQGEILDGLNRYRACQRLGIEPKFTEYKGDDPLHYVISINVHRRHMSVSQLAMVATEMLPEFEKEAKKRKGIKGSASRDAEVVLNHEGYAKSSLQAAREFGISQPSVERAKRIKEQAPEKVEAIRQGKETVKSVDNELRIKEAREYVAKEYDKALDKEVKKRPQIVSNYFEEIKNYKSILAIAIASAKIGMFAEESKNIIIGKHGEINNLMKELEELI